MKAVINWIFTNTNTHWVVSNLKVGLLLFFGLFLAFFAAAVWQQTDIRPSVSRPQVAYVNISRWKRLPARCVTVDGLVVIVQDTETGNRLQIRDRGVRSLAGGDNQLRTEGLLSDVLRDRDLLFVTNYAEDGRGNKMGYVYVEGGQGEFTSLASLLEKFPSHFQIEERLRPPELIVSK